MKAFDLNNVISPYNSGFSIMAIRKFTTYSAAAIKKILSENGIYIRSRSEQRTLTSCIMYDSHLDKVREFYNKGYGITNISKRLGLNAMMLKSFMIKNGIKIRSLAEQNKINGRMLSDKSRKAIGEAARKFHSGKAISNEILDKMAESRYKTGNVRASVYEDFFAKFLDDKAIKYVRQLNIGKYNCDFSVFGIAVEIWGGQWHFSGAHAARNNERFKYILDSGVNVIIAPIPSQNGFTVAMAENIISHCKELSGNPPFITEYRMIWRDGETITRFRNNIDNFSFESPFTYARNRETGRYYSVRK